MKKLLMILLGSLLCSWVIAENAQSELCIMSYNIRNGKGLHGDGTTEDVATVINRMSPDIVALQEIDSVTGRSDGRFILNELALLTNTNASYAAAIDFDGGRYGIGLLSKEKPVCIKRLHLPGREERRVLLIAEFADYVFFATHLSLTPEDQISSLAIIDSMAKMYEKPLFLAGDLNFRPTTEQHKRLCENFTIISNDQMPTFPADKPTECIDYIASYTNKAHSVKRKNASVIDAPTQSDHRPIVANIVYNFLRASDSE